MSQEKKRDFKAFKAFKEKRFMISRREFFAYSLLALGSLVHRHFGAPSAKLAPVVPGTGFVDAGSYRGKVKWVDIRK